MLKKLLAVSIAILMICSSMAVVSFADTTEEPVVEQEWVEDFNNLSSNQLLTGDANTVYVAAKDAGDCHGIAHYHLNNDWILADNDGTNLFGVADSYYDVYPSGRGKINSDKTLVWDKTGWAETTYFQNTFGGTPVALSDEKSVGISFDWFSQVTQLHNNHVNIYPNIQAIVTFTNGTTTYEDVVINLAQIYGYSVNAASGSKVSVQSTETWNNFNACITNNKIIIRGNIDSSIISFDVEDYDPTTGAWSSASNDSGFEISSVKAVRIYNTRGNYGQSGNCKHGFDNLKAYTLSGVPTAIEAPSYSNFMDFSAIMKTEGGNGEGDGKRFLLADGNGNAGSCFALSENNTSGSPITVSVMENDTTVKSTRYADGFLKISNTAGTYITGSPLCYIKNDTVSTPRADVGDKVQFSYDFKLTGNENASSTSRWLELTFRLASGSGEAVYVSGNGTVYDPANPSVAIAKLKADTWYSMDTVAELTADGTLVNVYLDGKHILTKTLSDEYKTDSSTNFAARITYRNVANAEMTGYLENTACFDNLCYQIFKGGANAYNFDKSASAATNDAIANADVDFVNNTIFPVAADFTVADFNSLGLTNATVLNDDKQTEAADTDNLAGKVIKFTGDYGKDVYYTVSSEGGANVTANSFVTLRENLGTTFATSATAGKLLTAKAVKDGAELEVYIAEYADNELVGLTVGEGVANYKPKAAGNEIKVFIWNDGELVPAFSGAASTLSVN